MFRRSAKPARDVKKWPSGQSTIALVDFRKLLLVCIVSGKTPYTAPVVEEKSRETVTQSNCCWSWKTVSLSVRRVMESRNRIFCR